VKAELIQQLKVGEVVETVPVFQSVSDEPLCFKVERTDAYDPDRPTAPGCLVEFSLWYFDVPVGTWAVKVGQANGDPAKLIWIDVEKAKGEMH
jgi:hypothetical protein